MKKILQSIIIMAAAAVLITGCDLLDSSGKKFLPYGDPQIPASSDASLKSLEIDNFALSPVFDAATTTYSLTVKKDDGNPSTTDDVAALTIKAIGPDGSTVTGAINGGTPSALSVDTDFRATFTLDSLLDTNSILVSVASEDGTATKDYTIVVSYYGTSASLANLSVAITPSTPGGISSAMETFASTTYSYNVTISYAVTSIDITATTPAGSGMSISIDGWTADSGIPVSISDLRTYGANRTIAVIVKSQDLGTTKTYNIKVTRDMAPSSEAHLSSLVVQHVYLGTHTDTLSPEATTAKLLETDQFYTLALGWIWGPITMKFQVTPVNSSVSSISGRISVGGGSQTSFTFSKSGNTWSASPSTQIPTDNYGEIWIDVTAENGTTTKTYKITVNVSSS
jgi:hypothetical protein